MADVGAGVTSPVLHHDVGRRDGLVITAQVERCTCPELDPLSRGQAEIVDALDRAVFGD